MDDMSYEAYLAISAVEQSATRNRFFAQVLTDAHDIPPKRED